MLHPRLYPMGGTLKGFLAPRRTTDPGQMSIESSQREIDGSLLQKQSSLRCAEMDARNPQSARCSESCQASRALKNRVFKTE